MWEVSVSESGSRTKEHDSLREADRDRAQWSDIAERLERLLPLRDQFAAEIAAEDAKQVASQQKRIIDLFTMSDPIDIANTIREQNVKEIDVIAALVLRNANNERTIDTLRSELADLRAQRSVSPVGPHPYRSSPTTAAKAPSSRLNASVASERVAGRPGAWRPAYGALGRSWHTAIAAAFTTGLVIFGAPHVPWPLTAIASLLAGLMIGVTWLIFTAPAPELRR